MQELHGKTAFITGAASGIGLGLARAFARQGMNVVLADIDLQSLQAARKVIESSGGRALAVALDVSVPEAFEQAADEAERAFGPVHVLCNNAGVALAGIPFEQLTRAEWDWIIAVNLRGVIIGVSTFLPRLRRHGEGGYIVNTASTTALQVSKGRYQSAYAVTKYGVVALSEALHHELEGSGIGISVLCPAAVRTRLLDAPRVRPERFGGPYERQESAPFKLELERDGLSPDSIAERVVQAIRDEEFFVLTHPEIRALLEARHRRLMDACDRAEQFSRTSCR